MCLLTGLVAGVFFLLVFIALHVLQNREDSIMDATTLEVSRPEQEPLLAASEEDTDVETAGEQGTYKLYIPVL